MARNVLAVRPRRFSDQPIERLGESRVHFKKGEVR